MALVEITEKKGRAAAFPTPLFPQKRESWGRPSVSLGTQHEHHMDKRAWGCQSLLVESFAFVSFFARAESVAGHALAYPHTPLSGGSGCGRTEGAGRRARHGVGGGSAVGVTPPVADWRTKGSAQAQSDTRQQADIGNPSECARAQGHRGHYLPVGADCAVLALWSHALNTNTQSVGERSYCACPNQPAPVCHHGVRVAGARQLCSSPQTLPSPPSPPVHISRATARSGDRESPSAYGRVGWGGAAGWRPLLWSPNTNNKQPWSAIHKNTFAHSEHTCCGKPNRARARACVPVANHLQLIIRVEVIFCSPTEGAGSVWVAQ